MKGLLLLVVDRSSQSRYCTIEAATSSNERDKELTITRWIALNRTARQVSYPSTEYLSGFETLQWRFGSLEL